MGRAMVDLVKIVSEAMGNINHQWDALKNHIFKELGIQEPIQIMPYRGYGTPDKLYLKGRVLEDEGIKLREEDAPLWKNLANMYRRFETDEIPGARLQVSFEDLQQQVVTNNEGFFEVKIQPQHTLNSDRLWQEVSLELLEPQRKDHKPVKATGEILIVSDSAKFGVISDIDDTVMHTAATDLLKMIYIAYLGNAQTRRPFAGVPEFYQSLRQGKSGNEGNPIFYISSSAWNMYDVFAKFMDFNNVPHGPILLRDIELSPANLLSFEHEKHKREQISPVLEHFSHLPFILIGDSGQKDAEIYTQIVHDYPERILGVYIRDVTPNNSQRQQELQSLAEKVRQAGSEFSVFPDTLSAAQDVAKKGWISQESLQTIPQSYNSAA
jgi:phosphatidate phosphatase APP1